MKTEKLLKNMSKVSKANKEVQDGIFAFKTLFDTVLTDYENLQSKYDKLEKAFEELLDEIYTVKDKNTKYKSRQDWGKLAGLDKETTK